MTPTTSYYPSVSPTGSRTHPQCLYRKYHFHLLPLCILYAQNTDQKKSVIDTRKACQRKVDPFWELVGSTIPKGQCADRKHKGNTIWFLKFKSRSQETWIMFLAPSQLSCTIKSSSSIPFVTLFSQGKARTGM